MKTAQVIPFQFEAREIRTLLIDDQPWFVATDVSSALLYSEAKDMTRNLDDDEKGRQIVPTHSGDQEMIVISESGLYHALLKSRKPEARPFRKWVTAEVLPAIRSHGCYGSPPAISERLQYARFLATFDEEGRMQLKQIAEDACVLSPKNAGSMTTLMREYVPAALLPDLMRIALDRLANMAGAK